MKTKATSLLVVLFLTAISCTAQRTITVEAQSNDISNNLDLQAVASTFGESKDLEDFERRLNDYDSKISNLDLNNDGEVDYLRVIENMENNVHVVVIQSILDKDVFQDVATIIVEKRENRRTMVQIVGDPYIYGNNYIIEPVYVYTPSIYSFFWGYNYHRWYSPYYYGYYPHYYHNRHPFEVNFYLSHVYSHINHDHRYFYTNRHYNEYADRLHHSMSRNDYGTRYPDRNFSNRNSNVSNKKDFDNRRNNNTIYDRTGDNRPGRSVENNNGSRNNGYSNGSRSVESRNSGMNERTNTPSTITRNPGTNRTQDDVYQNRTTRTENPGSRSNGNYQNNGNRSERNSSTQTYTPGRTQTDINRNTDVNRTNQNRTFEQRPTPTRTTETRPQPTVTRENNNNRPAPVVNQPSRPAPVVNQPSRPAQVVSQPTKQAETPRNNDNKTERGSRSSNNERR